MKRVARISSHTYKNYTYKNSETNQIIFIDNLIINPQSSDLGKHTAKEYHIEYLSKNIEENFVLRIKEREKGI